MKKAGLIIFLTVFLLIGAMIAGYPFISNYLMGLNSASEIQTYLSAASDMDKQEISAELARAQKYNESLLSGVKLGDPFSHENENNDDEYYSLLNLSGTSVMASIEIPSIGIKYPIYHGTSDSVLEKGIGHMRGTSLPIGGKSTHAVLSGHSGLSTSELFTNIDKLEKGDKFYISVLNETLAYSVDSITVVKPDDTSLLEIVPEEDHVTLVTCTPFGVNTHRLLVRGSRAPYTPGEESAQAQRTIKSTWNEEYTRAAIIGVAVMLGIIALYVVFRIVVKLFGKRRKNEKSDKNANEEEN